MYRWFVIIIFISAILSFCNSSKHQPDNKPQAVEVRLNSELGETIYRYYYWNDLVMYEHFVSTANSKTLSVISYDSVIAVKGDTVISEINIAITKKDPLIDSGRKRSAYFIYHKDSTGGLYYSRHPNPSRMEVTLADELFLYKINNSQKFLDRKPDSLDWSSNKTMSKEVFVESNYEGHKIQYQLFFSNRRFPYSLSNELDKSRQMTLYKYVFTENAHFAKNINRQVPAISMIVELKEYYPQHIEEIIGLFERYKVDVGKNK